MALTWKVLGLVAYFATPLFAAECFDDGCSEDYDGLGKCLNVAEMDYSSLPGLFDLKAGSKREGCKGDDGDSCKSCNCFKQKNCHDDGCKEAFDGLGFCVDVTDADWAAMDKYVDWGAGKKDGLCKNINSQHCCGCFKKKVDGEGCPQTEECTAKEGKCLDPKDPSIPKDWEPRSDVSCEGKTCKCYSKKDDEPTCHLSSDQCKEKDGRCLNPEKDEIPTFMEPTDIDCGRNCKCYVKKDDEPTCSQSNECTEKADIKSHAKCFNPDKDEIPSFMRPKNLDCGKDCKCYVKKDDAPPTCTQSEQCEEKDGKCWNPDEMSPGEIPTFMEPTSIYCGNDCKCYVKKDDEPTCAQTDQCKKMDGKCWNPEKDEIPTFMEPTSSDCGRDCKCYVKKDDEPTCIQYDSCKATNGKCLNPDIDEIPTFLKPTTHSCGRDCKCYVEKEDAPTCSQNDECKDMNGKCLNPDIDEIPTFMEPTSSDCGTTSRDCKCYVKKTDEPTCPRDEKCDKMHGKCFGTKEEHTAPDGFKPVHKCGDECVCFAPAIVSKCRNRNCEKAKGKCFMKGEKIPAGSKPMKGKLAWCDKKLKCKCYKVKA